MKLRLLILFLLIVTSVSFGQQELTREEVIAQEIGVIDSLCLAVQHYYPLEILDSVMWGDACDAAKHRLRATPPNVVTGVGGELTRLLTILTGRPTSPDKYLPIDPEEIIGMPMPLYYEGAWLDQRNTNFPELIWNINDESESYDRSANEILEKVRSADGLLLNLGREGDDMTLAEAESIAGRFVSVRVPYLQAKVRVAGERRYIYKTLSVEPTGEWQYDRPIVFMVDSNLTWPGRALVQALKWGRRYVEVVGDIVPPPKAILPKSVQLHEGIVVSIPTAIPLSADGQNRLNALVPDVRSNDRRGDGTKRLEELVRRYKRERTDRMEDLFRK